MSKILDIKVIEDPSMPPNQIKIKSSTDEVTIINIEGDIMGGNGDNVEAELEAMRQAEQASQQREAIRRSEELTREALKIQREAKKGKK